MAGENNARRNSFKEAAMRAAEEELERRRERGKLSQARFRKRQAEAAQETRVQNEKMKDAIAEVVRATQRSDRHGLLEAVRAAADAAGVDASGLDGAHVGRVGEENAIYRRGDDRELENSSFSVQEDNGRHHKTQRPDLQQMRLQPPAASHTCRGNDAWQLWSTSTLAGCLRPRLKQGFWVDILPKRPPVAVMPFIGTGRYTFRGHLYWTCTEYLLALCRVVTTPHSPPVWFACQPGSCPTPQEAEHRVWTHIQHSPPVPSVCALQAMAEEQKGYSVLDYEYGDSVACYEESPRDRPTCWSIAEEPRGDPSIWMGIIELEGHVRQQLGREAFSRLERTIGACCITQSSKAVNEELMTVVRLLMKNLAESFICFGNGPHWRKEAVSTLFQDAMKV